MESVFRLLKGYLTILISKHGFVRFLNLCIRDNLDIWNVIEQNDVIQINISIHDFRKIKEAVKKSKVNIRIIKRIGLPFVLIKMRRYIILFVGILFCLFLLYYQKMHIWTLETDGNIFITDEQIEDCLRDYGFHAGISCEEFNSNRIERMLKESFDVFSWVCASLDGTTLRISVIENIVTNHDLTKDDYPSSLYASKDGIIKKLVVNQGYTTLKPGDEIHAGDLLISGEVPFDNNDGTKSYYLTAAQGEYLCEIRIPYFSSLERNSDKKIYESWKNIFPNIQFGVLFGPDFTTLSNEDNQIILREYNDINFLSLFDLNIYYISTYKNHFKNEEIKYEDNELQDLLKKEFIYFIKDLEKNDAINITPEVSFQISDNSIILSGYITYYDSNMNRNYISPQTEGKSEDGNDNTDNGT